jgi:TRAP-type C4-dicarboxylate transport system permease small subunit
MGALLTAIERRTTAFALWCACLMLAAAAGAGLYQIFSRFVIEQPSEWTEVVVRFGLIWMVFLAVPTAFRQGAMVSVDLLYRLSGPTLRRALDALILATSLLLMGIIFWYGWDYTYRTRFQTIPGVESLTMVWAYGAMPVGAVFSIIAILGQWFDPRRNELETTQ